MTTTETPSVRIERSFAAPVETVWRMWTDPDHFRRWYGPDGARVPVAEWDLEVGARRFVAMEMDTPDGPMTMRFVGEFLEISEPTALRYTEAMADESGQPLTAEQMGMPAGTPMSTEVVVQLTSTPAGTDLVLTHVGVPADSGGAAGWAMALEKLAAIVG